MDMLMKQAEYVKKTPQRNAPAIKATAYTLRAGTKIDANGDGLYGLAGSRMIRPAPVRPHGAC